MAQAEFRQIFPQPGWVEHDPEEIWRTQLDVAREALAKARISARDLAAIGITNQRETTVLWDRATGAPIANAIVWQDRRTADECARLERAGHAPRVAAKTGLVLDPVLLGHQARVAPRPRPGRARRAERGELAFGTIDTLARLEAHRRRGCTSPTRRTPRARCSSTSAPAPGTTSCSRSSTCRARCCPRCGRSSGVLGTDRRRGCSTPRVPIAGIAGDQQAALFGQALPRAGHGEEHLRHRLLPAAQHRARAGRVAARPAHDARGIARRARPSTRSRAACSSPARSCSGCATGSA